MTIVLTVFHIVACFFLIAVILLQAGRGQGLSTSLGSGEGTQSVFGTRSADLLSKATTVTAIVFLTTCLTLDIMHARKSRSLFDTKKVSKEDLAKLQDALNKLKENPPPSSASAPQGETAAVQPPGPSRGAAEDDQTVPAAPEVPPLPANAVPPAPEPAGKTEAKS